MLGMMKADDTEYEMLEAIVDRNGLSGVLEMLSDICGAKAAHVAETWQDASLAKAWDANADKLARVTLRSTE